MSFALAVAGLSQLSPFRRSAYLQVLSSAFKRLKKKCCAVMCKADLPRLIPKETTPAAQGTKAARDPVLSSYYRVASLLKASKAMPGRWPLGKGGGDGACGAYKGAERAERAEVQRFGGAQQLFL
eukprot:scaffold48_cov311-Pinguiococcus_pyrenoidosus.AAC.248